MVRRYMEEIYRVLTPGGVGVIYFPRLIKSRKEQSWKEVQADMEKEKGHSLGYREGGFSSKVKSIAIVISMWKMEEIIFRSGFTLLEKTASWDRVGKRLIHHGQYGVAFQKPKLEEDKQVPKRVKKD
jgi:hypothetical protein